MGIPTINEFTEFGYANGPDLLVNDGANLAEIHGNLDKRVNIDNYKSYNAVHFHSWAGWAVTYSAGAEIALFRMFFPYAAEITHAHVIGFGDDTSTNTEFDDSGGDSNNSITSMYRLFDEAGNISGGFEYNMTAGNIDYGGALATSVKVGAGYTLSWIGKTHPSAHGSFFPWLQTTLIIKQEHV
jgi:hypothetical protein